MNSGEEQMPIAAVTLRARRLLGGLGYAGLCVVVVASAIVTKELTYAPALLQVERVEPAERPMAASIGAMVPAERPVRAPRPAKSPAPVGVHAADAFAHDPAHDPEVRWFDGRPVRPARVVYMTVTAYSPDARSCGVFADGQTATLHSVWTNGMQLVAADPKVLPYGSMLTIPGYANEEIVPVLDCGGAIKGKRLDVLYATHERALRWGVQRLPVVVWEYADGKPAPNPRRRR